MGRGRQGEKNSEHFRAGREDQEYPVPWPPLYMRRIKKEEYF